MHNKKYYEAIEILCFARLLKSVLKIILNYLLIIRDLFTTGNSICNLSFCIIEHKYTCTCIIAYKVCKLEINLNLKLSNTAV